MKEIHPSGAVFAELMGELLDLVNNPSISSISVSIASYELDENGQRKIVNGQDSVAICSFDVSGAVNEEVKQQIHGEINARPIRNLMVFWMDRSKGMGSLRFGSANDRKSARLSSSDRVEKAMISGYLHRRTKSR